MPRPPPQPEPTMRNCLKITKLWAQRHLTHVFEHYPVRNYLARLTLLGLFCPPYAQTVGTWHATSAAPTRIHHVHLFENNEIMIYNNQSHQRHLYFCHMVVSVGWVGLRQSDAACHVPTANRQIFWWKKPPRATKPVGTWHATSAAPTRIHHAHSFENYEIMGTMSSHPCFRHYPVRDYFARLTPWGCFARHKHKR